MLLCSAGAVATTAVTSTDVGFVLQQSLAEVVWQQYFIGVPPQKRKRCLVVTSNLEYIRSVKHAANHVFYEVSSTSEH